MGLDGTLEGVRVATSASCHRHHRYCVVPVPEDPDSWTFHCAGSTCVDFSLRSKSRLGLLGPHMCPFVGWAFMRRSPHMAHHARMCCAASNGVVVEPLHR